MSTAARPHFAFGVMIAAATLMLDQASKLWIVRALDLRLGERIVVTPFLDFVLALNIGISYGLFPQGGEFGRWALVALKLSAAALFTFWMSKATSRLTAAALALLVGGALGNAIDRVIYGAVVDFVSLHAFGWRWYVFNLADTAIVAGVAALLYDALAGSVTKSPPSG